jgi:hypothetical protein
MDYVCSTLECASCGGAGEPKGQRAELNGLRADGSLRGVTWERQQRRVPVRTVSVHATVSAVAPTMPPFPSCVVRAARMTYSMT